MKIVLHEMGTYTHAQQLAQALRRRGHEVVYAYCPACQTPCLSSMCFSPDDGVAVVGIDLDGGFSKRNFARRFWQERAYGGRAASVIADLRPDVVISGNTPIEVQAIIQKMCRRTATPYFLWLQDIYSIGIRSVLARVPVVGNIVAERYALLERKVLRRSDGIVAISDDFRDLLIDWGVEPGRISVIENWAALPDGARPTRDNDWAARHGLSGKRVLLYSGTLGFKHNPQLFLDLASEFRTEPDVRIVVISEGHGVEWLAQRQREFPGLVLLPFQPADDFWMALASADVLVAVLEPEAAQYSVPAKVLTYMAAGRAILAAIEERNLAARTVLAASAGMVADPRDPDALRRLARSLVEDGALRQGCADAAFAYARAHFAIDAIAGRFEQAVHQFVGRRQAARRGASSLGEPASVSR